MSLPAPYSEVYLAGDGVSTVFAFGNNFDPISDTLVKCKIYFSDGYETVPTFTVDMTTRSITISALTQSDGTILTAPPVGSVVRIYRDEPEAQNITASQLQSFTAKQLESALDAIVAMIQEVSYTVDHKTVRLTEPQRDIALQELSQLADQHLIYWDFDSRKLVVTNFPQQDVVRCVNGLFFRIKVDPDTQHEYLQWSLDESDWHSVNVDAAQALAQDAYDLASEAKQIADEAKDTADDAKEISESIDGKAQQALDNSVEALETAEEAKEMIQDQIIIRSATMPTASAELLGKAYQYAGATDGQYTHNYIYECQATEINTLTFTPNTVSCDWANLQTFLETIVPGYSDDVVSGTMTYLDAGDLWAIVFKNANGDTVTSYQQYTGDWEQIGFSFAGSFADGDVVSFVRNTTTTYAWVRVDVQPDRIAQIQALQADITDIQALIPAQASPTNQLGDKNFINSSIATNTANFIGTFNSVAELEAYSGTKTNNDYAFVIGTDSAGNTTYNRYKYTTATTPAGWVYEYTLNNSSFTAAQWAAIQSGITATKVAKYDGYEADIADKQEKLVSGTNIKTVNNVSLLGSGNIDIGADALPDQTGNAGKFLTTDGTDASWGDALINRGNISFESVIIGDQTMNNNMRYNCLVGYNTRSFGNGNVRFGNRGQDYGTYNTSVGTYHATTSNVYGTVNLGYGCEPTTSQTLNVRFPGATGYQGVTPMYELLSADGTIPEARLADTTNAQQGDVLTLDSTGNAVWQAGGGGSSVGRNVGDIFKTNRTDSLAGAVECNGATYNTTDFTGTGSVGELLEAGKLDYVSLPVYVQTLTTLGYCDKIGWGGTGNTTFRVPTLGPKRYVVKVQDPTSENNYTWYRIYSDGWVEQGGQVNDTTDGGIIVSLPIRVADANYTPQITGTYISNTGTATNEGASKAAGSFSARGLTRFTLWKQPATPYGWRVDAYAERHTAPTERYMIQLASGATDTALETCTEVLSDVAGLKSHEVIEFQAPTSQNNYTWYRKYADGWVEQGGMAIENSNNPASVTFPVEMADTYYTAIATNSPTTAENSWGWAIINKNSRTTTGMSIKSLQGTGNETYTRASWQVSGMAAS